jgi:ABC-type transport system involved in multi-copper enzyme maturation permease subunit
MRKGNLVVSTISIWLILIRSKVFLTWHNLNKFSEMSAMQAGEQAFEMSWVGFLYLSIFLLPMTAILSFPYERNHKIIELNYSMPITAKEYLLGKIIGIWLIILINSFFCILLYVIINILFFGVIEINLLLELFFFSAIPLLFWSSGISFLAGFFIESQKLALIIGLLIGALSINIWSLLFRDIPSPYMGLTFSRADLLVRQQSADYIFSKYDLLAPYLSSITLKQFFSAICIQLIILFFLFLFVVYIAKSKEGVA